MPLVPRIHKKTVYLMNQRYQKWSYYTSDYIGAYESKYLVNKERLIGMDGEFRCYEWKGEQALLTNVFVS